MADPGVGCVALPGTAVSAETDIVTVILHTTGLLMTAVASIAVIGLMYGGILYITAMGDVMKISKAKRALFWSGIGLVAALLGKAIAYFVIEFI